MKSEEGTIKMNIKDEESKNEFANKNLEYGSFLRTSKLTETGIVDYKKHKVHVAENRITPLFILNDDELFAACGGRTAHK